MKTRFNIKAFIKLFYLLILNFKIKINSIIYKKYINNY